MANPIAYSNLVAWYPFEDGTGVDLTAGDTNSGDSTDYSLTVNGATHSTTGGVYDINNGGDSGVFSFDGTDDNLNNTSTSIISGSNARSYSAWIKTTNSNDQVILDQGEDALGSRFTFRIDSTNDVLRCEVAGDAFLGTTKVTDGSWHHVVFRYDGSGDLSGCDIYLDGQLEATNSSTQSINTTDTEFVVGKYVSTKGGFNFNGKIDDARLYNKDLTDAEIDEIYNSTNPSQYSILEDFSTGSFSNEFTINDADFNIKTNRTYKSTYSAGIEDSSDVTQADVANYVPDELAGGKKVNRIKWLWKENNSSYGAGIRIQDSNGNTLGGFCTDNPEWYVQEGYESFTQIYDGNGNYDQWIEFEMVFDYANNQITYNGENLKTGATASVTKGSVNTLDDVEQIDFVNFASGVGYSKLIYNGNNNNMHMWYDQIQAKGISSYSVVTDSATNITKTVATLNGTVDDLGDQSSVNTYFDYRKVGNNSFTTVSVGSQSTTGSFSDTVTNLSEGTDYEYKSRIEDTNGNTLDNSNLVTFTTDSVARFTSSTSTFTTADNRYVSGVQSFYTDGINYSISVNEISTDTAQLVLNVDNINNVSGGEFRFYIDGTQKEEKDIVSTGTYTTTVNGLTPDTQYYYTVEYYNSLNLIELQSTTFNTVSEAGTKIGYTTTFEIDASNDINETPIIDAIGNGDALDIQEYQLKDTNGNVLFSATSDSQLSITQPSSRTAEFESITFNSQTADSDTIAVISLLSSLSDEVVNAQVSDISGGQRIEIIIPVNSN